MRTHRPKELSKNFGLEVPPVGADRVGAVEVGEHQDVEQLGAWSRSARRTAWRQRGVKESDRGLAVRCGLHVHPTTRGTDKDYRFTAVAELLGIAGEVDDDHVLAAPADVGVLAKSALQQIVTRSTD